ncbi:MAG: hypothetical protein M0D53_09340 [Flavobacterium sp. JAD_PAG50586_2]|nr:MAG: hypothetical protein M0D53_09340 [Flavobacterium sp. JAD_PAG50586_2]
MKRILIKENNNLQLDITRDLDQFTPVLSALKTSYEAFEIGPFTHEVFKYAILAGPDKHVQNYLASLNDQLDKLQITNSIIRENSLKNHELVIENFKKALSDVIKFRPETYATSRPKLTTKFISVNGNGLFFISKEDNENILETYCRIYIENEEEKRIFDCIENLKNSFNQFLEFHGETGLQNANSFLTIAGVLKETNDRRLEFSAEGFKSMVTYKSRLDEFNK